MIKNSVFILFIFAFIGCKKDTEIPAPVSVCKIDYQIDHTQNCTLKGNTWKFIGFQKNDSTRIDYPPCPVLLYVQATDSTIIFPAREITISFMDSLNHPGSDFQMYSHRFEGTSTVNSYYGGCNLDNYNNVKCGGAFTTLVKGPDIFMDYEYKYHKALKTAYRYSIDHNFLTIYYGEKDKMLYIKK